MDEHLLLYVVVGVQSAPGVALVVDGGVWPASVVALVVDGGLRPAPGVPPDVDAGASLVVMKLLPAPMLLFGRVTCPVHHLDWHLPSVNGMAGSRS